MELRELDHGTLTEIESVCLSIYPSILKQQHPKYLFKTFRKAKLPRHENQRETTGWGKRLRSGKRGQMVPTPAMVPAPILTLLASLPLVNRDRQVFTLSPQTKELALCFTV